MTDDPLPHLPAPRDSRHALWRQSLAALSAYVVEHSAPPSGNPPAPNEERRLAHWLMRQRRDARSGKLAAHKRTDLDLTVPGWTSHETMWSSNVPRGRAAHKSRRVVLAECAVWVRNHDGLLPRHGADDPTERRYGAWLTNMRLFARRGAMTDEDRAAFDAAIPGWLDTRDGRGNRTSVTADCPTVVTIVEGAEIIGVAHSTLYKRRQREPDAPEPIGTTTQGGALYDLDELTAWALRDRAGDGATHRTATIERGDSVTCLECGRRLQTLAHHVRTHDLTPDQYREKHGIPYTAPLATPHMRAHASATAVERGVGRNLTPGDPDGRRQRSGVEHLRTSRRERQQTEEWKAARALAVEAMRKRRREQLLAKLRERGYDSIEAAVEATRHLSAPAAAQALGTGPTSVRRWREQHPGNDENAPSQPEG